MKTIKKILSISSTVVVAAVLIAAFSVSATTITIGNDSNSRTQLDTFSNFTVIDVNHMVTSSGQIASFGYYAANMNLFSFVVVSNQNVVKYVSPEITPSAVGAGTYTPLSPVSVSAGDNLGVYFASTGTIPFENTGASAMWTANGSGMPTVGMTLSQTTSGSRTYSIAGYGTTTTVTPVLTSVSLSPSSVTLNVGATQQLTANPIDQNSAAFSGAGVTYSSSNTAVATVSSSGLVTGVAVGSATITATAVSGSTTVMGTSMVTVSSGSGGNPSPFSALALRIRIQVLTNELNVIINLLNNLIARLNGLPI